MAGSSTDEARDLRKIFRLAKTITVEGDRPLNNPPGPPRCECGAPIGSCAHTGGIK